jgi:hypothetical protein
VQLFARKFGNQIIHEIQKLTPAPATIDTDCAADSDNARIDRLFQGAIVMVTLLPVL